MFDFVNLFKGRVSEREKVVTIPVGKGRTVNVDANGDIVYATCIEILSKQIGQVKWGLYGEDNKEVENLMSLFRFVLNVSPYPGITATQFWSYMEKQRVGTGNALCYIKYDENGLLQYLVPLDGSQVKVYWDDANIFEGKRRIIYEYTDLVSKQTYTLLPEEVLHFKAYSANGIVGRPAIEVLLNTLKSNAEVESALRTAVSNGFHGTIVLSYTSELSQSRQETLQKRIKNMLSNANNTILPLPVGMSAQNIANDIKAYTDSLKASNAQAISSFMGVPLVMLNIGGGTGMATFSSNQITQYYNLTIAPILQSYANEISLKLLTRKQLNKGYAFDTVSNAFDFLDPQAKASVVCSYVMNGILTRNEGRRTIMYPASQSVGADELISNVQSGGLGDSAGNEGGGDKGE